MTAVTQGQGLEQSSDIEEYNEQAQMEQEIRSKARELIKNLIRPQLRAGQEIDKNSILYGVRVRFVRQGIKLNRDLMLQIEGAFAEVEDEMARTPELDISIFDPTPEEEAELIREAFETAVNSKGTSIKRAIDLFSDES